MTSSLHQAMTDLAAEVPEWTTPPPPEPLWTRGRRARRLARITSVALVAAVVVLLASGLTVLRSAPTRTVPAGEGRLTYPTVVREWFPLTLPSDEPPVFGLVVAPNANSTGLYAVMRTGILATVPGPSMLQGARSIAPDGVHVMATEGIVDLGEGLLTRTVNEATPSEERTGTGGLWSRDSQHVLVATAEGPVVFDLFANRVLEPALGDADVLPAGWSGPSTVLGVRVRSEGDVPGADILSRALGDSRWQTVARVDVSDVDTPLNAYASPEGSRLLLIGADRRALLVDTQSGTRLPLGSSAAPAGWDICEPVWRGQEPLLAGGGLRRASGESVMSFSGPMDLECIRLAGDVLTGDPQVDTAAAARERTVLVLLSLAGVLGLIGAGWIIVGLRESRRRGERFLPMIYVQRF